MSNQKEAKDRVINPRVLTNAEFYLAMTEDPDPSSLGLRPEKRSFFVGQEGPYQQLREALTKSPNGTIIAISGPIGAGKDALLDVVIMDLRAQGILRADEVHTAIIDDFRNVQEFEDLDRHLLWEDKPEGWPKVYPKVLILNEVSSNRGRRPEEYKKYLEQAGKFLGKEAPIIVLLGNLVENRELISALGSPREPINIRLDPLTQDVLKEALRRRLAFSLERSPEEIDVDGMFDPDVLPPLLPNAEYPIANMRMTLSIIKSLRRDIKPTKEPFKVTGELIKKHFAEKWAGLFFGDGYSNWPVEKIQQFKLWLIGHINNHGSGRVPMQALTLDQIMQACPLGLSADEYQKEIINRLYNIGQVKKVGASQDRYLPSQDVFLEATFGQLWLDPESEEGQEELKRVEEFFYGLIRQHVVWGLSDKEYEKRKDKLMQDAQFLYGWDPEFISGLIDRVTVRVGQDEEEKKRKQREIEKKYGNKSRKQS